MLKKIASFFQHWRKAVSWWEALGPNLVFLVKVCSRLLKGVIERWERTEVSYLSVGREFLSRISSRIRSIFSSSLSNSGLAFLASLSHSNRLTTPCREVCVLSLSCSAWSLLKVLLIVGVSLSYQRPRFSSSFLEIISSSIAFSWRKALPTQGVFVSGLGKEQGGYELCVYFGLWYSHCGQDRDFGVLEWKAKVACLISVGLYLYLLRKLGNYWAHPCVFQRKKRMNYAWMIVWL